MPSTLKSIINLVVAFFVIILVAYVVLLIMPLVIPEIGQEFLGNAIAQVSAIGREGWGFVRPFLQLVVILVIIDWILSKWGITLQSRASTLDWNVQTVIALIVIGAYSISALGGITGGTTALKDLTLLVVGFYFGTQKRSIDMQTENGKVTIVEEHQNDVLIQSKDKNEDKTIDSNGG